MPVLEKLGKAVRRPGAALGAVLSLARGYGYQLCYRCVGIRFSVASAEDVASGNGRVPPP